MPVVFLRLHSGLVKLGCITVAVLKDAADTVEENGIQGSSTCCVVLVDTLQGRLTSANIGDSGFLLIGESDLMIITQTSAELVLQGSSVRSCTYGAPAALMRKS